MKYLLLFFGLLAFGIASSQTPNYFANDPRWRTGSAGPDEFGETIYSNQTLFINGDTTIESMVYFNLQAEGYRSSTGVFSTSAYFNESTGFLLRQQDRSIYYRHPDFDGERLFADYDYEVGDSLMGDMLTSNCLNQPLIVATKDSILIGDEYRNLYTIEDSNHAILEGVGHQLSASTDLGGIIYPLCGRLGTEDYFYCFSLGEESVWDAFWEGGQSNATVGIAKITEGEVNIFPNPSTVSFTIETSQPFRSARLLTMDGKEVEQILQTSVNTSTYAPGLYVVEITFNDGSISRKRLIID